jgi:transposase
LQFQGFFSGDKLASWLETVPNVYQSSDKFYNDRITKRGSKEVRLFYADSSSGRRK